MKASDKTDMLSDAKNRRIPIRSWIPSRASCQIVLIHGLCEHIDCYGSVAENLSNQGIAIHLMDLPGHGMAQGIRGHIDHYREYLDNITLLVEKNPNFLAGKPAFLMGHSLGGLIATQYCLRRENHFRGLILTSPLIGFVKPGSVITSFVAEKLAKNHSNHPFPKPNSPKSLSRNPDHWQFYNSDPLRGRLITPNLYLQMAAMIKSLNLASSALSIPLLMFISTKDRVVSPEASKLFFARVGSRDKSMVVFTQAMHELLQEQERKQVLDRVQSWIRDRC